MLKYTTYRIKALLSQRILVFWALIFPIFLASIFHISFTNIKTTIIDKSINVGFVNECDGNFSSVMKDVEVDDIQLFKAKCTNKEEGQQLLEDNKIAGLIEVKKDDIQILFKHDNFNRMIIQEFSDTYLQKSKLVEHASEDKPSLLQTKWIDDFVKNINHLEEGKVNEKIDNPMIINMLTVIAMATLFAAYFPLEGTKTLLANMSNQGIRVSISPMKKSKLYFIEFFIAICIAMIVQLVLIAFMIYVLGYDLSNQLQAILLICFVGSIFSTTLGFAISVLFKKSENAKIGFLTGYTLICSFLSGMMESSIKYSIDTTLPLVNKLNPVALITDSFYIIYYYDEIARIIPYLQILIAMSFVLLIISIMILRRKNYDTI